MKVWVRDYDGGATQITQDELDEIVNSMLVNLHRFSEIACLEGKAYGVKTLCNTCPVEIDGCGRNHLVRELIASQNFAEVSILHAGVTPRYRVYEELWGRQSKIQVEPGISAVNVQRVYSDADAYPISPYVIVDPPVENTPPANYCVLTLDGDLVTNPARIQVRDSADANIEIQNHFGYPRRNEDGDWLIALGKNAPAPDCVENSYNVQSCEYMYVDVEVPECEGQYLPFYPDCHQFIPVAKIEDLGDGVSRYWFWVWTLVDDAFSDEQIDLSQGQFYKLLQEIEFRCVTEEAVEAELIWRTLDNDCVVAYTTDEDISVLIHDAKRGVLEIDPAAFRCCSCGRAPSGCGCHHESPLRLRIRYKTDPRILEMNSILPFVSDAIAHMAAAELPTTACHCKIGEEGFIAEAHKAYNKVRQTPLGETITTQKIGNLYGQLVFKEKLGRVPKKFKVFQI